MKPSHIIFSLSVCALLLGCQKTEQPVDQKADNRATESREENVVTLNNENRKHMDLQTEIAQVGILARTLKAVGRVSANMNKTAKVTPTFEGKLTKLNFDLNDHVKIGDVMALVDSPELLGRQIELKAPMDGVVIERKAAIGELVDKTKEIYTVSDPTQLWVIAEIKERDIAVVKVGQEATFTVLPYPQENFHGKVVLVGNEVESSSRTVEARLLVDNADGRLKPGMFADVEILTTVLQDVLLISDGALQTDADNQIVFVAKDNNRFEKRVIKLGEEQEGRVQVLDGLKPGEKVVTSGSFILKSEMLKGELGEE